MFPSGSRRYVERWRTSDDQSHHQRPDTLGRCGSDNAVALRAARSTGVERRQVRLRARPVRGVHGDRRWGGDVLLRHPDLGSDGTADQDRRGAGHSRRTGTVTAGLHRRASCAMWLLHRRHDHASASPARKKSCTIGCRDPAPHDAEPVPVRYAHAHPARGAARGRRNERSERQGQAGRVMKRGTNVGLGLAAPVSRRGFLAASGALIVSFTVLPAMRLSAQQTASDAKLPGSLGKTPLLDAWIRVDADGGVTVFTGKAELGQGIKTAFIQIAAEQIGVDPARITLVTADTGRTADEGFTAGSRSLTDSGTAIMHAAAQVREILISRAVERLGVAAERLQARDGAVVTDDGRRVAFGELVATGGSPARAQAQSKLKDPASYSVMGKPMPRVDIPAKVTGGEAYVQDLRLPGMVHARVVRPPSYGARLSDVQTDAAQKLPGVLKVVRDGNFLGVIAEREYQAIVAMRALAASAKWSEPSGLPEPSKLYEFLRQTPSNEIVDLDRRAAANPPAGARTIEASYRRPYQMHAAIGPSCAVAWLDDSTLTVWTHSQGVYPLRRAIAEMLNLPQDRVRCIHAEGSGCYGHNAADDAGGDAALLARAFPGRPVRVQWMREQEHMWEPYGPAMLTEAKASLDATGRVVDWQYAVWSNTHSTRPGNAASLAAARHLATPFAPAPPQPLPLPEGGGDRNAIPLYAFPAARVVHHFIPA